jgi:hypothetical protein
MGKSYQMSQEWQAKCFEGQQTVQNRSSVTPNAIGIFCRTALVDYSRFCKLLTHVQSE